MRVSVLAIVFMAISALASIGLPVVLAVIFRKKYNAKIIPMIMGIAGFVLFALILERSVHTIVFGNFALSEKPLLYILYGIFMAGIFEETARFLSFKIIRKKYTGIGTGLAYGVGHGGIEAILLAGLPVVNSILFSIMLNTGNLEGLTAQLQGDVLEQINAQAAAIAATPPYLFLIGGMERIFSIAAQLSLSLLVFYSVYGKNKLWLYPFAILLHAVIDIPAAAMQVGIIKNVMVVELLILIGAASSIVIAKYTHGKLKEEITET